MLKDYPQSLTNADILGQGNLNLASENLGKSQGILLSIICGNPAETMKIGFLKTRPVFLKTMPGFLKTRPDKKRPGFLKTRPMCRVFCLFVWCLTYV